jgi:hypothetical protein
MEHVSSSQATHSMQALTKRRLGDSRDAADLACGSLAAETRPPLGESCHAVIPRLLFWSPDIYLEAVLTLSLRYPLIVQPLKYQDTTRIS